MPRANEEPGLGVVAIGRNEGERLRRCLESVLAQCGRVVYVDSGSRDGSVALARALGAEVLELDTRVPFSAARARNEGLQRLRELHPALEFVQFVDGDCELQAGWIQAALASLRGRAALAAVCGRRRERFRNATVYNRLCDIEWNTPVGEVESCGGDVLMRVAAFAEAGGFDPGLICGEEPDLCRRLRARGHVILRIDAEMTLHDAAMTRLGQWWRRSMRTGFGAAESLARHGAALSQGDRRCIRGAVLWVAVFPALIVLGLVLAARRESPGTALAVGAIGVGLAGAQTVRIAARRTAPGEDATDARLYALSCMAAKLPQALGMLRYLRSRLRRSTPRLIEYK
jgi:GT2 family glycosyltransferase